MFCYLYVHILLLFKLNQKCILKVNILGNIIQKYNGLLFSICCLVNKKISMKCCFQITAMWSWPGPKLPHHIYETDGPERRIIWSWSWFSLCFYNPSLLITKCSIRYLKPIEVVETGWLKMWNYFNEKLLENLDLNFFVLFSRCSCWSWQ